MRSACIKPSGYVFSEPETNPSHQFAAGFAPIDETFSKVQIAHFFC